MIIKEVSIDEIQYINEIVELEKLTFGKFGGVDLWILKPLIKFGKVFIAIENEKIIGAAEFLISSDSPHAFLYGLSTHKLHQNKGVANSLLLFCEKYFFKKGIKKISLTVDPKNIKAISLYKKNNFHITSLKKNEYGIDIHRFIMEKKLN